VTTNCSVIADASFKPRDLNLIPYFLKISLSACVVSIPFFFNLQTA
ncbi:uncharacterized protein METZ01_LOCUS219315, partial [marine metagenome]